MDPEWGGNEEELTIVANRVKAVTELKEKVGSMKYQVPPQAEAVGEAAEEDGDAADSRGRGRGRGQRGRGQ